MKSNRIRRGRTLNQDRMNLAILRFVTNVVDAVWGGLKMNERHGILRALWIAAMALGIAALILSAPQTVSAQDRIALIIGNDKYTITPLKTAASDARLLAAAAIDVGFRVKRI